MASSMGDADAASAAMRPTTLKCGFVAPAIWSFPPFFTLQPNPTTLAHQLKLWSEIILGWARHARVYTLNVDSHDAGDVFENKAIGRRLLPPSLKQVLAHMAKEGMAAADPPKQTSTYLLYWRKPEEWGELIHNWVTDNGLTGTIMTFYEVTEGDLAHMTEFYELAPAMLRKSLDTLVKRGKAQIIRSADGEGDGVRFL